MADTTAGIEVTERGPGVPGRRITVYNLVPWLLDGTRTEQEMADWFRITPADVAAARAYVLAHFADVMAMHEKFEARDAAGNSPEVLAKIAGGSPAWRAALERAGRHDLLAKLGSADAPS